MPCGTEYADLVAVRGRVQATHRGSLFGVAPTGNRVNFLAGDFHRLRDGKIVESWHVEDWLSVMFQIGAIKM